MKIKLILALLISVFALNTSSNAQDTTQTIPSLELKDLEGKTIKTEEISKGKLTIFSFWATWCGPCIKELDNISEVYEEWQKKYDLQLVAVSIDDARNSLKVNPKVKSHGWQYPVLLDENKLFFNAINGTNPPLTIVVSATGHIIYTHQGYVEGSEFEMEKIIKEYTGKE